MATADAEGQCATRWQRFFARSVLDIIEQYEDPALLGAMIARVVTGATNVAASGDVGFTRQDQLDRMAEDAASAGAIAAVAQLLDLGAGADTLLRRALSSSAFRTTTAALLVVVCRAVDQRGDHQIDEPLPIASKLTATSDPREADIRQAMTLIELSVALANPDAVDALLQRGAAPRLRPQTVSSVLSLCFSRVPPCARVLRHIAQFTGMSFDALMRDAVSCKALKVGWLKTFVDVAGESVVTMPLCQLALEVAPARCFRSS